MEEMAVEIHQLRGSQCRCNGHLIGGKGLARERDRLVAVIRPVDLGCVLEGSIRTNGRSSRMFRSRHFG